MNNIYLWLEEVCSPIRYKPDHDAAYKELKDHYQDHLDYLKEQGVRPNAAELEALDAMGDASEMRRMMAAAYRPALTLLWRISRVVLVVIAVFAVVAGLRWIGGQDWSYLRDPEEAILSGMAFYREPGPDTSITEGYCSDAAKLGDYKITVTRALKCRNRVETDPVTVDHFIVLILKAKGPVTLGAPPDLQFYVTAKDDKGSFYDSAWKKVGGQHPERYVSMSGGSAKNGIGYYYYHAWLSGTDPDLEWIDLTYDHLGKSFTLRVSFDKEAGK
ncbi:MAG: hypothetical protein IKX89_03315 [Firmicutes bacterium]|nr:hypothetical protein [Bacillota bacterium]